MKKKNALFAAMLIQGTLYCTHYTVTLETQKKRNALITRWGPDLVEELTKGDARSAIDFLNDLDLDAVTPRTPDIASLPDGHIIIEYSKFLPAPEKFLVIATPTTSAEKHLTIAERTPSMTIGETDSLEPYKKLLPKSPSNSEKNPKQPQSPQTPISREPGISDKQPLIKKKSTTIVTFIRTCTTIIALVALVYFLSNSISSAKIS